MCNGIHDTFLNSLKRKQLSRREERLFFGVDLKPPPQHRHTLVENPRNGPEYLYLARA